MKKLAYLILVHDDEEQLARLVNAINYNSDIYIHVDKKADIKKFRSAITLPNVVFLEDRVAVSWAGISMVDALMKLISEVLKQSEKYSHAVFLTGSCYPIKNITTIYDYISLQPQREFIKLVDMRESPEHYMTLINRRWFKEPFFRSTNNILKTADKGVRFLLTKLRFKNRWDKNIVPYFGHTWCCLTMNCCEYVYNFHVKNPWFRKMNKYTFASDEHYLHTIIGNSPYLSASLGIAPFKGRGLYKYTNFHLIDPSLTKWYSMKDWQEIIESDKFFIRKVNSKHSRELIENINSKLLEVNHTSATIEMH